MKNYYFKILVSIFVLFICSNCVLAYTENLQNSSLCNRIKLQDASSVSEKANKSQLNTPLMINSPLYNSATGGVGNFVQGITDNGTSAYSMQNQRRQETEYIKQAQ